MKVLIVTHYFPPELGAPQARLSELARHWADAGDEVTVLTGMPNHPNGVVPPAYRGRLRMEESIAGYRVVRTWLYATPNKGVLRRTLAHLSFLVSSVVLGTRPAGPADVVVVSSPTFFSIFSSWFIARMKRSSFVVEVRDLWPAIIAELGVIRNRSVIRVLELMELAAYRAADAVVVVTEGFRDNLVGRGVDPGKVQVIPNGVDVARFDTAVAQNGARHALRSQLGAAEGQMLVLYAGTHGISHGLVSVADAARRLDGDGIHVAFVGQGAAKPELERHVAKLGLTNVTLHPSVPRDEVPELLAAADVCLVSLRDIPLFATFIPSKMFEYLAAGRPVVGMLRGEAAAILERAGAVVVDPEDDEALAEVLRELARDGTRRDAMACQGRRFVEEHFDRAQLAVRYRSVLAGLGCAATSAKTAAG